MANLTITVDEETLKRARIKAIEQGTSVNRVLGRYLAVYAGDAPDRDAGREAAERGASTDAPERAAFTFDRGDEAERKRRLEAFERHVAMAKEAGARSGGITWTREDLYDRRDSDWTDS